jgi:hypothetical protein
MKRNLLLQLSSQFRNCAITFCFAPPKSSQIPTLCNTCSVVVKLMENSLGGSLSFRSTTSSSPHPRVRRPSFSQNLSQPFPLTHPVHPSTRTFPMNISSTSPLMIRGMATSSYTYELKSSGQHLSRDDRRRIRHQAPRYLLIGDILYRRGIDTILRRCVTIDEVDKVLNDCHSGACGGHLSGIATAQKIIRAGYFWPTLFHDCIHAMRRCEQCQLYANKARAPPALLHPVITAGPFCKWGIDFMTCNPPSNNGHKYIVVAVDYFTKWAEAMPTFNNTADTAAHFFFNHVISRFGVPLQLVSDHGKHFENEIFIELSSRLGFSHEFASPYYPQSNGQVEAVNKVLKTMLQRTVNKHKTNWHHMLFSALWAYRTAVKIATGFTPFHLVHGVRGNSSH